VERLPRRRRRDPHRVWSGIWGILCSECSICLFFAHQCLAEGGFRYGWHWQEFPWLPSVSLSRGSTSWKN
jgi:hypothetical protein